MTKLDAITELLAKAALFAPLDAAARESVARQMRPVTFAAGQAIFARGDAGSEIYLVLEGRVRLSVLTLEGRELSFAHATAGDIFGEIAALDGGCRTADATAVDRVRAMTLPRAGLLGLIATTPAAAAAAIGFLCARLREADQQLENVALYPIEVRLARFLLGLLQDDGLRDKAARATIALTMSQGELALLVGATRPKVNGALAALAASGAIERRDSAIICDIGELRRIAEFD